MNEKVFFGGLISSSKYATEQRETSCYVPVQVDTFAEIHSTQLWDFFDDDAGLF
jgi:hypothetical protein